MWYKMINDMYNGYDSKGNRLWSIERVKEAVSLCKITEAEYKKITREDYIG